MSIRDKCDVCGVIIIDGQCSAGGERVRTPSWVTCCLCLILSNMPFILHVGSGASYVFFKCSDKEIKKTSMEKGYEC